MIPKGGPQGLCWGPRGVSPSPAACLCLQGLCQHLQGLCQFPKHCARPWGAVCWCPQGGANVHRGCHEVLPGSFPRAVPGPQQGAGVPGLRCVPMVSPVLTPGGAAVCQGPQSCARSWARLAWGRDSTEESRHSGGTKPPSGGPRCCQGTGGTIRDQQPEGAMCASGRLGGRQLGFKLHGGGEGDGDNRRAWPRAGG